MNNITVSALTVKRLISDIKEMNKNSLSKDGIYYKHDESNMLLGYALIIGPENTPYQYGFYFFQVDLHLCLLRLSKFHSNPSLVK